MEEKNLAIVTTGYKSRPADCLLAQETAERLGIPFVKRRHISYEDLRVQYGALFVLVVKKGGLRLETSDGELFFHPNMAHVRVRELGRGQKDHMVEAMGIGEGDTVLDCTLGLGADSITASFIAGERGKVTALEKSPLIYEIVRHGLAHFSAGNYDLHAAMRRVEVRRADYEVFLRTLPDDSYDVVYFDPMFRHPLKDSVQLAPLRLLAESAPVSLSAVAEACRVARRRVVLKENSRSLEFARLGFSHITGGKYSPVHYGVLDV